MKDAAMELLKGLLKSKKFAALLAGLLVLVAVYPLTRWAGMSEAEAKEFAEPLALKAVAMVSAYLISQGVADHGKEAKKLEKASA